jgi:hypothetical protein
VEQDDLVLGNIYFIVSFIDPELTTPSVEPIRYIGTQGKPKRPRQYIFESEMYGDPKQIHLFSRKSLRGVYIFDECFNEIARCLLRRRFSQEAN